MHIKGFPGVLQSDYQSVGLVFFHLVDGRQSGDAVFSLQDLITHIAQLAGSGAVRIAYFQCASPVIAASVGGILLRQSVQRIGALVVHIIRVAGEPAVRVGDQIGVIKNGSLFAKQGME